MKCPSCGCGLQERRIGTSRAFACASCGGAWVAFGSIEAVLPRLGEIARGVRPAGGGGQPRGAERLKCPECGGDLVKVKSGEMRGMTLCTCLVCFGRWADGSELARMGRRGILARLLDMFSSGESGPGPAAGAEGQGGAGAGEQAGGQPGEESARTLPPDGEGRG